MVDPNAPMNLGLLVTVTIVFPLIYFVIGGFVLTAWLGDPVNWPLFLKKAVAGTGEYRTSPNGSSPWPGHVRHDRLVSSTPELARRHHRVDEEAANGRGVINRMNSPQQETGATTGEARDISRARKIGGSLLVFFTGFLVWFLWPLAVLYGFVWWFAYGIWAWHYIYLSTRGVRSLAQAHARDGDQQRSIHGVGNDAIIVTSNETSVTSEGTDGIPASTHEGSATTLNRRGETGRATVMSGGEFHHFYPQAGKFSRKVKTVLDYESAMPTPIWSKAAMLHAERKRRDMLDGGLYNQTPREKVNTQHAPKGLETSPDGINTVIQARIPIRQSSAQQNGRRLKRQPRLDPWPRRYAGDIELRTIQSSRLTPLVKAGETAITPSSVPERRGSAQRTGIRNVARNGSHQTLPASNRPWTPDRISGIRDVRKLFTIDEGDVAEEEERSSGDSVNSRVPQQVVSPATGGAQNGGH